MWALDVEGPPKNLFLVMSSDIAKETALLIYSQLLKTIMGFYNFIVREHWLFFSLVQLLQRHLSGLHNTCIGIVLRSVASYREF